ncbi:MAG: hypothetical protein HN691_18320 [Bacteroidetes bacterium]|jgi:uncharacterized protein (DUF4213/DUF364 family)|nr:hypothetical protein [Bacteroidota bacterium]MBT7996831.1 hypothetical protein [Bacteroidota bacterium]
MLEPIQHFYQKEGFQIDNIKNITIGQKYVAVEIMNGNIGVCATLNHSVKTDFTKLDLTDNSYRIVLNAYYNALLNYNNNYEDSFDIFDKIDFHQAGNVVMVGYFKSLVQKFEEENISLSIFDLYDESDKIVAIEKQQEYIAKSDTLILSSTSIFNQTFFDLVNSTPPNCHVYLLGPSSLLHPDMFKFKNISVLFGSLFQNNKDKLIDIIKQGEGTPSFSKYMQKVYLKN